jgi:thioredoxin-like negative regulator of GroEL
MSEQEKIGKVVAALEGLPEKRLLIIELANQLTGADGMIDFQKVADRQPEVNLAMAEARSYSGAAEDALNALVKLPARARLP